MGYQAPMKRPLPLGWLAALALLLTAAPAHALDQVGQAWALGTVTWAPGEQLRLYGEVQPRLTFSSPVSSVAIVRGAVGWQAARRFSLWLGGAWIPALAPSFKADNELRAYEQVTYTDTILGTVDFVWRTRFEQRFMGAAGGTPALRLRSMFRLQWNVASWTDGTFIGAALYDEPFWNFTQVTGTAAKGFDQNRAFIGATWRFLPYLGVEAGYLNQYLHGAKRMGHGPLVWVQWVP